MRKRGEEMKNEAMNGMANSDMAATDTSAVNTYADEMSTGGVPTTGTDTAANGKVQTDMAGRAIFAVSLSHKTAEALLRESVSLNEGEICRFYESCGEYGISEAVYLYTCNRCEIYGVGDAAAALRLLAEISGAKENLLKSRALIFEGARATRHMFRVCCGLESAVAGEDEILGQIKKAFAFAQERHATGYILNTVCKAAVTTAKRVKTDTLISKSSVSVATLAALCCRKHHAKTVLLIGGGGEMGGKVLKNLLSYPDIRVYATVRNRHLAKAPTLTEIPYEKRYEYADCADCIISATKSPHYTILEELLEQHTPTKKPRLLLDLAVPRDIDESVRTLDGVTLLRLEDLEAQANRNRQIKATEIGTAEDIIAEELEELSKTLLFHSLLPTIEAAGDEVAHFIYRFRDCATAREFESFTRVLLREGTK